MEIDSAGSVSSSLRLTVSCDLPLHLHGAHGRRFFPGLWVLGSRSSPLSSRLVHTAPFSLWKISPPILNSFLTPAHLRFPLSGALAGIMISASFSMCFHNPCAEFRFFDVHS